MGAWAGVCVGAEARQGVETERRTVRRVAQFCGGVRGDAVRTFFEDAWRAHSEGAPSVSVRCGGSHCVSLIERDAHNSLRRVCARESFRQTGRFPVLCLRVSVLRYNKYHANSAGSCASLRNKRRASIPAPCSGRPFHCPPCHSVGEHERGQTFIVFPATKSGLRRPFTPP